jgi:hypothetical protein
VGEENPVTSEIREMRVGEENLGGLEGFNE